MFEDRKNRTKLPFNAGTPAIFTLAAGGFIALGNIIIAGVVKLVGGTISGTLFEGGGPEGLIKRIVVTGNRAQGSRYPGGKLVDCSPRMLLEYAATQHSGKRFGELSGSTLGDGAAGEYNIYLSIPVYFADATLRNSMSTSLCVEKTAYSSVQVMVETASDLSGCFTGSDRVLDASGLTIQWEDQRYGLSGDVVPMVQEEHVMLIATTFDRATDAAMPSDGAITSMLLLSEAGTPRTLSDALLNKVTLTGSTIALENYSKDIKQRMINDEWYDPSQSMVGRHFLDFTAGNLLNSNPAAGLAATYDVSNVSGANIDRIRFYTRRVFGLAPVAGA